MGRKPKLTNAENEEAHFTVGSNKILLRALKYYSNGQIQGGVGVDWRAGEIRAVSPAQYYQLMTDSPKCFEKAGESNDYDNADDA